LGGLEEPKPLYQRDLDLAHPAEFESATSAFGGQRSAFIPSFLEVP
jgi:hypothetical protein